MALQSSGQIRFSDIKTEFSDPGKAQLGSYRTLNSQGVTQLPSSGEISFSDFYGVSKTVSATVTSLSRYYDVTWSWNHQDTYIFAPHSDAWCPTGPAYGDGALIGFAPGSTGTPSDSLLYSAIGCKPQALTNTYSNVQKNDVTNGDIRFSYDETTTTNLSIDT